MEFCVELERSCNMGAEIGATTSTFGYDDYVAEFGFRDPNRTFRENHASLTQNAKLIMENAPTT